MKEEEFREVFFKAAAGDGDVLSEEWFEDYFEERVGGMDLEFSGQTDSGNYSSGDESMKIYRSSEDMRAFWTLSTFKGLQGPFETLDDAWRALGYDPSNPPEEKYGEEE